MTIRTRITAVAIAFAAALPLPALAHNTWLMPSATVLPQNQSITVDAAVSNDLFYFNHRPLGLESLVIATPDGSVATAQNSHSGKFRSVFDLELAANGTYRIALVNNGLFANWEENGEQKRWRGTIATFATEVPKDASKLQVTQSAGRIETFVTAGTPNLTALTPTGVGLELAPTTHPNDLFAGETAQFALLLDGKPAAGVEVKVIAGGTRYRNSLDEISATTDAVGKFTIAWPAAGMYWMQASVQDSDGVSPPATQRRASYVATFEVLPQ
ncbi:MAG: DUF4198 domain-containing protein [Pseudomarimonas sp.]